MRSRVPVRLAVEVLGERRSTAAAEQRALVGEEAEVADADEALGEQVK